jgi:SpoVK/Ycf46/Vps4 family AAA+-type ATPase
MMEAKVTPDTADIAVEGGEIESPAPQANGIWQALRELDGLLEGAVAAAQIAYGPEATADPFRGLHVSQDEVQRLLSREPGGLTFQSEDEEAWDRLAGALDSDTHLVWFRETFGLTSFDMALVLIALAPEIDLDYERIYAFLQNDVSKKRPSVELALNLLCPSRELKLMRRALFAPSAPLIEQGMLHLLPDPNLNDPPLLAHFLKLDEQILGLLLEQEDLDRRLGFCCELVYPTLCMDELALAEARRAELTDLVAGACEAYRPLRLYFQGPTGVGRHQAAEALANEVDALLLVVDIPRALTGEMGFGELLRILIREAWLRDALLYLEGADALFSENRAIEYGLLVDRLAEDAGVSILAGVAPWPALDRVAGQLDLGLISVAFAPPEFPQRRECWRRSLADAGVTLKDDDLDLLTGRFRLTPAQISESVAAASHKALSANPASSTDPTGPSELQPALQDLLAAARAQSGQGLATLAPKVRPLYRWDDIVLPEDTLAQLRELCQRVTYGHRVLGEWGFADKLSMGKGINALFAGPSGTGKTMAAEVIANELALDMHKIDLSGVVSKYIGETEKNLDRIFTAAENSNAILFFDEADALFGKRSEVRDSHDRYANIEISYLLQKMEEYEGIAILATNLRTNLDESFARRLAFTVYFPFPEERERRLIWDRIWPANIPLKDDLDLDFLARQFTLSGGNIGNTALAAAFSAAADSDVVTMEHVMQAMQLEYRKIGKIVSDTELNYGKLSRVT